MSTFFAPNLSFLRKKKGMTQIEVATALGLKRNTFSNYETTHSEPDLGTLEKIASFFDISIDELVSVDLSKGNLIEYREEDENKENSNPKGNVGGNLTNITRQYLPPGDEDTPVSIVAESLQPYRRFLAPKIITMDSHGEENIIYVPIKARAGYMAGFGDPQFIQSLSAYRLPGYTNGTYRIFEVEGHSMFPTLQDADRVIARWADISDVRDDRVYVLVTRQGILIKRLINRYHEGKIIVKSDNNHAGEFPTIVLDVAEVAEIWYVVERWTRQLPGPGEIYKRLVNIEAELAMLKQKMGD
ncbi:helix-turn-helix domain-containing protein [Niastella caeni]|uniref:Helix-turn-helix domain-containing protein n=1 Tax=Niastella caeni TaxID=2569763 RepID=A0A4V4H0K0_9BACT|nr:helix-turn-helix domain-containing protein [Niastella caeni]THU36896.1 helix-turn-helix domain-containing protein [Niastella caeni]